MICLCMPVILVPHTSRRDVGTMIEGCIDLYELTFFNVFGAVVACGHNAVDIAIIDQFRRVPNIKHDELPQITGTKVHH